jgi:hypothetical protein
MYVEIQASTKTLWKRDGSRLRARDAREALRRARNLFPEDAPQRREDVGLRRR